MVKPNPDHPAKYPEEVLAQIRSVVRSEAARLGRPPNLLDNMAGTGRIHQLRPLAMTYAVEIEPEWAACHPDTICGDALQPPEEWQGWFDIVCTSITYGNRFADHHAAGDLCRQCKGAKLVDGRKCTLCKGKGLSPRKSYKTSLGRDPSDGSSATLQWGPAWRDFHKRYFADGMWSLLDDGGLAILNIKNHERHYEMQRVVEWCITAMFDQGFYIEAVLPVATRGMRFGAHWNQRAAVEQIVVMRKPTPSEFRP